MKRVFSAMLLAVVMGLSQNGSAKAQILGGHMVHSGIGHTFGGYNGVPVHTYQEPLAARPAAPAWSGFPNEPILSARTVTSAGEWPNGAIQPPAPVNHATIGPKSQNFFGWNSFWWYDPSQGSPIWNTYNSGRY
jgi:hypothetical protein